MSFNTGTVAQADVHRRRRAVSLTVLDPRPVRWISVSGWPLVDEGADGHIDRRPGVHRADTYPFRQPGDVVSRCGSLSNIDSRGFRERYATRTECTGGRFVAAVNHVAPASFEPNTSPEVAPK